MAVQHLLEKSEELTSWLDLSIHGLPIEPSTRNSIAVGLFDTVHEHRKAMILLVKNKFIGLSFSLFRPEFESLVRAIWVLRCASESDLDNFSDEFFEPKIASIIKSIETLHPWDSGFLSSVYESAWKSMCSYAHGGSLQFCRRFNGNQITPNYSDEEVSEVINSSNVFALISACEIAAIADNPSFGRLAYDRLSDYLPSSP